LTFARQQWPNPDGRVLPVMARKTPDKDIPPYLRAVNYVTPQGNTAAETSVAIEKMGGGSWRFGYRSATVIGLSCAVTVTAMLAYIFIIPNRRLPPITPPLPQAPSYGIYLTGVTESQKAVQEAKKAKSIAQSIGRERNEIRLYRRRLPRTESFLWAIVVVYTDSAAATGDKFKYEPDRNSWDPNPEVINLQSWCPYAHPIPSPTGSEIEFATIDCT
jgi:hypothetical protein